MPEGYNEEEIDLAELLAVIFRHWKKIVILVGISVIFTAFFSLSQPAKYEATAVFFPLELFNPGETVNGFKPKVNVEDLISSILKSREIADQIIQKLDLMNLWKKKFLFEARGTLDGLTKVTFEKGGIIKLVVRTKDPELSAKIANAYIDKLNEFNKKLMISANISLVQTIDRAVPPERRMSRGTRKKVFLAFFVSSFFSIFLVFMIEWLKKSDFRSKLTRSI